MAANGVKADLTKAREEYVQGIQDGDEIHWPTLDELLPRHNVSRSVIHHRAAEEHWLDERTAFQHFIAAQRREDRARELGELGIAFDREAIDVARVGLRLVAGRMHEIGVATLPEENRTREDRMRYPHLEFESANARELAALARAAFTYQSLGRRALGEVDTGRLEITGDGGGPVRVDVVAELLRDNPDRLTGFMVTAARAGLLDRFDPDTEVIDVGDPRDNGGAGVGPPLPQDDGGGED